MSAYACVIIGLEYVGASDGFPTRISVGDLVGLEREPSHPLDSAVIAAYYEDRKIGYLSSEKQALWDTLAPSARHQAKVIGEILDEDGNLAGLDIELNVTGERQEPLSAMEPEIAGRTPRNRKTLRAIIGLGALFLMVLADADTTGPAGRISAVTDATSGVPLIDQLLMPDRADNIKSQDRSMVLTQIVKLTPSDQVKLLSMPHGQSPVESNEAIDSSAEQMQAQEMSRISQQAAAHRLAQYLRQRAEAERLLGQAQVQKTQQLAEELQKSQETVARQQTRIAQLDRQAFETATQRRAENRKLERDIILLRRQIEEMLLAQQQLEKDRGKQLALSEMTQRELARHKNQLVAWALANRRQNRALENITTSQRKVPSTEAKAALVVTIDKSKKKRVKANFSRYAQENRVSD